MTASSPVEDKAKTMVNQILTDPSRASRTRSLAVGVTPSAREDKTEL
jgi:hypothetical protein